MNPYHFDKHQHWAGVKARVLREREEQAEAEHQAALAAHPETDVGKFVSVEKAPFVSITDRLKQARGVRQG